MDTTKIAVLLNVAAGASDPGPQLQNIVQAFSAFGIVPKVWVTRSGRELTDAAQEALDSGHPVLIAAGGDGTISKVADIVFRTGAVLGVLPQGTLNHFAKDLRIPLDLGQAVAVIAAGHARRIDTGSANGRTFLNNASIGLYPHLLRQRERVRKKGLSKWVALVWATLVVLIRRPVRLRVRIAVEERVIEAVTNFVFIGNNEYEVSGFRLGMRQRLDGHFLSLYLSRRTTRSGTLLLMLRALLGFVKHTGGQDFEIYRAQELWIDSEKDELQLALDGELTTIRTPIHFSAQPSCLTVLTENSG